MSRTKCQKRKLCSLLRRCQLHTVILCNKNCVVLHCTFDNQYMYIIVTERNTEQCELFYFLDLPDSCNCGSQCIMNLQMLFLSNLNINFTQEIIVCISEMLYSYHLMHILMHLCCYINYMLGVVSNNLAWCQYDTASCAIGSFL